MTNHQTPTYDGMTIWNLISTFWVAASYTDVESARSMIRGANPTIRDWTSSPLIDLWGNVVDTVNVPFL